MSEQHAIVPFVTQVKRRQFLQEGKLKGLAEQDGDYLLRFLYPLIQQLHTTVDIRPLRTPVQTVESLLAFRDSTYGLSWRFHRRTWIVLLALVVWPVIGQQARGKSFFPVLDRLMCQCRAPL